MALHFYPRKFFVLPFVSAGVDISPRQPSHEQHTISRISLVEMPLVSQNSMVRVQQVGLRETHLGTPGDWIPLVCKMATQTLEFYHKDVVLALEPRMLRMVVVVDTCVDACVDADAGACVDVGGYLLACKGVALTQLL